MEQVALSRTLPDTGQPRPTALGRHGYFESHQTVKSTHARKSIPQHDCSEHKPWPKPDPPVVDVYSPTAQGAAVDCEFARERPQGTSPPFQRRLMATALGFKRSDDLAYELENTTRSHHDLVTDDEVDGGCLPTEARSEVSRHCDRQTIPVGFSDINWRLPHGAIFSLVRSRGNN